MADLPDFTLSTDIVAQTIESVAVDIIAQTLTTLGVNIKAQDLTQLDIDIIAQTLAELAIKTTGTTKLAIDIAAQTLSELGINITAQDLAELVIKISAQDVGVYIGAEWECKEGNQKYFRVTASNQASLSSALATYEVPTGKTLYITHVGGDMYGTTAADRDKNQICRVALTEQVSGIGRFETGGNGGVAAILLTPIKFIAAEVMVYRLMNLSNHNCELYLTIGGYEI